MTPTLIPVLLVEDNPGDARLIREMLAESGAARFVLTRTDSLAGALDLLPTLRGVVLLDLSLPDSFGLDTFRAVAAAAPEVPVVVLTGLADETAAVQAVQEGAQDYLVKGQVTPTQLAHALRYAIGRHQRQQGMASALRATEEELELARKIQQHLFPAAAPACGGFDVHGASFCAATTGGDFFDYLTWPGERVGLVIGDVTGHGVGPALLMAATRAYLRAYAQTLADVGQILTLANRVLTADMADGRNVTLLLAQLDGQRGTLLHASAGHYPGFVLDRAGAVRRELYSTGLPLGIVPDADYPVAEPVELRPGEVVLLLTDGVVEAESPAGEPFGRDRALSLVRTHRNRPAHAIVEALYEGVRKFADGQPQADDVTAIVIKAGTSSI